MYIASLHLSVVGMVLLHFASILHLRVRFLDSDLPVKNPVVLATYLQVVLWKKFLALLKAIRI